MSAADWALADATRDAIYKRKGRSMSLAMDLAALAMWMHPQSDDYVAIMVNGDETRARITGLRISAGRLFHDTDVYGLIYWSIADETPGAGQARLRFYKDQARATLVAQGSGNNSTTLAIAAEAGYYLTADVDIGVIGDSTDGAILFLPPLSVLVDLLFDGTFPEDAQNKAAFLATIAEVRTALLGAAALMAGMAGTIQRTTFARLLKAITDKSVLVNQNLVRAEATGQVDSRAFGLLVDEVLAMAANSAGSTVMKAGAGTHAAATAESDGSYVRWTGPTLGVRAFPMVISAKCNKGLDAAAGDPTFTLIANPTDPRRKDQDGQAALEAGVPLRMGAQYAFPQWGIDALRLDYNPEITNEGGGTSLATTAGLWSVTGLTSENSEEGQHWTYYDAATTTLEFYKSEDGRDERDPNDLVTSVILATGDVNDDFRTDDRVGLVIFGRAGAGTAGLLVDGAKGTIDWRAPSANTPATVLTMTITESVRPSAWVRGTRDGAVGGQPGTPGAYEGGWKPHTAANPNILDGWIQAASWINNIRVFTRRSP